VTRGERVVFWTLAAFAWLSLIGFVGWWVQPGHVPANFHGLARGLDVLVFVVLTATFTHRLFMDGLTWILASRIRREELPPAPALGLRVAFITAFVPASEPLDMLRKTLLAMRAAEDPHDTWVLDEGGDDAVRELCASLRVKYFSRHGIRRYNVIVGPFARKTKGGNHNAWYDAHGDDYDIVAQLDADFRPNPNFLTRTLGYFNDPQVAFVGTPQVYGNTRKSFVARGAAQQLFSFYGPLMRGLGANEAANMIGANHIVRVAALRDIGSYAGHLTEDLLTGMRLHARGWKSRYVPTPLAVGEGPETWAAYFNQQTRWAFGCMDILRVHSRKLVKSMNRRNAITYVALQQHYFSGLAAALGVVLTSLYFTTGMAPANVPLKLMVVWATPLIVARFVMARWLQRFNPAPTRDRGLLLAGRYLSIVTWPIYFLAFVGVFRQRRMSFKVTPKGGNQTAPLHPSVAVPHIIAGGITLADLAVGLSLHRLSLPMVAWASANSLFMLSFAGWVFLASSQSRFARLRRVQFMRFRRSLVLIDADVVDEHLLRPGRRRIWAARPVTANSDVQQ
jgi:cellulose synthase (UDP-forming)